jgi:hypothetical protein
MKFILRYLSVAVIIQEKNAYSYWIRSIAKIGRLVPKHAALITISGAGDAACVGLNVI